MATFTIPSLTIPAGQQVFGPFAVAGGWQHVDVTLDIAALTSADVTVEFSVDGAAWRHVMSEIGLMIALDKLGIPIITERFVGDWSAPWPTGFIRVQLNNAVAFLSSGGSLVVT